MPTFIGHSEVKTFLESKVTLSGEAAQKHRDQVNGLRDRLKNHIAANPGFSLVKMLHSGSVAKGTALKSVNDLDVAVYVKKEDSPESENELIPWFSARLKEANPNMGSHQFVENDHSVTVSFSGSGLDVDVVPVLYEGDANDCGYLVPRGSAERVLTSIPLHLQFIRSRKNRYPHFVAIVRLAKWWANLQKDEDTEDVFRCKSFLLELLVAHLADEGLDLSDYPEALNEVLTYIVKTGLLERIVFNDYYPVSEAAESPEGSIAVFDPVNPENNICSSYSDAQRRELVRRAELAADAIDEANYSNTKGRAVECWQRVLGSAFRG